MIRALILDFLYTNESCISFSCYRLRNCCKGVVTSDILGQVPVCRITDCYLNYPVALLRCHNPLFLF